MSACQTNDCDWILSNKSWSRVSLSFIHSRLGARNLNLTNERFASFWAFWHWNIGNIQHLKVLKYRPEFLIELELFLNKEISKFLKVSKVILSNDYLSLVFTLLLFPWSIIRFISKGNPFCRLSCLLIKNLTRSCLIAAKLKYLEKKSSFPLLIF